jgi:hypothetical protein
VIEIFENRAKGFVNVVVIIDGKRNIEIMLALSFVFGYTP